MNDHYRGLQEVFGLRAIILRLIIFAGEFFRQPPIILVRAGYLELDILEAGYFGAETLEVKKEAGLNSTAVTTFTFVRRLLYRKVRLGCSHSLDFRKRNLAPAVGHLQYLISNTALPATNYNLCVLGPGVSCSRCRSGLCVAAHAPPSPLWTRSPA